MSWAKAAGVIVCEPSLTAYSGSSWTSTIKPSAPAAMAALDIGSDQLSLAGPVRGVDDHRQVALVLEVGHGGQRQGEPGVVLVGPDSSLAEHDVGVVAVEDVLGGEQELIDGRAHPSLEEGRLARVAHGLEELIVLHVPGADLEDVGVPGDHRDVLGAMTSVTIARPVTSRAVASILRPSSLCPWKLYGLVLGLKAPPLRPVAPIDFKGLRQGDDLGFALDRAGAGDHADLDPADFQAAGLDDGPLGRQLGGGPLVGGEDRQDLVDPLAGLEDFGQPLVARRRWRRSRCAGCR